MKNLFINITLIVATLVTLTGSFSVMALSNDNGLPLDNQTAGIQVVAGENKGVTASTIVVSEDHPLVLDENNSVTLVAGKTITLLPGTKITSGSFMYASIATKDKTGKKIKKTSRLVTVEENEQIKVQENLEKAASMFSPFPSAREDRFRSAASGNGSYTVFYQKESGIAQEHNPKIGALVAERECSGLKLTVHRMNILPAYCVNHSECRYILRL